jgi:membrane-bound lytic murein transglycosylase D
MLLAGAYINVPIRGYRNVKVGANQKTGKIQEARHSIKYKVKKGDTLASIARNFGTSVSDIQTINNLSGSNLKYGTTLKINRN